MNRTFNEDEIRDIVVKKLETIMTEEMGYIGNISGDQVIDANDPMPLGKKAIAKVRAEESGTASNNADNSSSLHSSLLVPSRNG